MADQPLGLRVGLGLVDLAPGPAGTVEVGAQEPSRLAGRVERYVERGTEVDRHRDGILPPAAGTPAARPYSGRGRPGGRARGGAGPAPSGPRCWCAAPVVLVLHAVGAADLVDLVLVGRGRAAAGNVLAHVLVGRASSSGSPASIRASSCGIASRRRKPLGRTPVRNASAATAVRRDGEPRARPAAGDARPGALDRARYAGGRLGAGFASSSIIDGGSGTTLRPPPPERQGLSAARRAGPRRRAQRRPARQVTTGSVAVRLSAVESASGPVEALAQLLDQLAVEPVVPAQGDLAGQPALARPAGHRVRRHAQQLRNLRTGQELRPDDSGCRFHCGFTPYRVLGRFGPEK